MRRLVCGLVASLVGSKSRSVSWLNSKRGLASNRYQDLLSYVTPDVALVRTPYECNGKSGAAIPQPNPGVCVHRHAPAAADSVCVTEHTRFAQLAQIAIRPDGLVQTLCPMEGFIIKFIRG